MDWSQITAYAWPIGNDRVRRYYGISMRLASLTIVFLATMASACPADEQFDAVVDSDSAIIASSKDVAGIELETIDFDTPNFPTTGCETSVCATPKWGISYFDIVPMRGGDESLRGVSIEPNERRNWSLVSGFGYETFRSAPEGGWQANGLYGSLNFGTRLGSFSDRTGIGMQVGASRGLYDWEGSPYRDNTDGTLQQDFVSYGLFRRATQSKPISFAVTQDWMFTENSGVFGVSNSVSQIRYRAGYATSASNEFGVIGAFRVVEDDDSTATLFVVTRPMNHTSAYWHHKWTADGANTIITIGVPENDRVNGDGSLGDFLATASVNVPLTDSVGFYGNIMYMNPTATAGFDAAQEEAWSFTLGIEIFPGHDARSRTIAGERWMPLLPIANNGSFLLDSAWSRR